jgi:hypothetical protein
MEDPRAGTLLWTWAVEYAQQKQRSGRLGRWLIARRLGLRCLVCNRRAGYGGRCPNSDHNG